MQNSIKSISLRELTWDEVDEFAHKHGFKDRSPFIEYCTSKEIHKKRLGDIRLIELAILFSIILTCILVIMRV